MRKLTLIIILLVFAVSCNRKIVPVITPIKDSTKQTTSNVETIKEIKLVPDTASIKALVKCDSLGNAYLAIINQLQGERVSQNFNQTVSGKDLVINIKATDRAKETQKETSKSNVQYIYKEKGVPYAVPVEVNRLTGWQWFQIWMGRILLVLVIVANIWKQIRNRVGTLKDLLNKAKSIFN